MSDDFILSNEDIERKEHGEKKFEKKEIVETPTVMNKPTMKRKRANPVPPHLRHFVEKSKAMKKERTRIHKEYTARSNYAKEKQLLHEERKAVFQQKYGGIFGGVKKFANSLNVSPKVRPKLTSTHARPFEGGLMSTNHSEKVNGLFGDTSGKSWIEDKPKGSKHLFGK